MGLFDNLINYHIPLGLLVIYVQIFILFVCLFIYPIIYLFDDNKKNIFSNITKNYCLSSISFVSKMLLSIRFYVNDKNLFHEMINSDEYIVIQNHLTELDSFILFNIINSHCDNFNLKTSLILRKVTSLLVPSYGFMSLFGNDVYIDKQQKQKSINELKKTKESSLIYIFPEATCYTEENKIKSDKYVFDNKLLKFKYLLYPKTTGLYKILEYNQDRMNYIYDLTVIFDSVKKMILVKNIPL